MHQVQLPNTNYKFLFLAYFFDEKKNIFDKALPIIQGYFFFNSDSTR